MRCQLDVAGSDDCARELSALATAHHHSYDRKGTTKVVEAEGSEEVDYEKNDALSGQSPPPPGRHRAALRKGTSSPSGAAWR